MKSTGLLSDFIAYGNSDSMKALQSLSRDNRYRPLCFLIGFLYRCLLKVHLIQPLKPQYLPGFIGCRQFNP